MEQIDSDIDSVKLIIAVATAELRTVYRPIKGKSQTKTKKTISVVAIIKGNVIGTAELLFYKNYILVQGVAVSPPYRKQGVARTIIEYIILRAQKESKTELVLNIIKETGNTNIFSHMGFTFASEEISEIYESVQSNQVTVVNMIKDITSCYTSISAST